MGCLRNILALACALACTPAVAADSACQTKALGQGKDLRFHLERVYVGSDCLSISYRNHRAQHVVESFIFNDAGLVIEEIVSALVGAGAGVREVAPRTASLEQVFSELTGAEPSHDGAARDPIPGLLLSEDGEGLLTVRARGR